MWYYSIDGQQQGPVDDASLENLVSGGVINAHTYVWKDGMADWVLLGTARSLAGAALSAGDGATCSVCSKAVGSDNLIELMGRRVCAQCKPMVLQSLREGASIPGELHAAWSEGKKVVAQDKAVLPPRCFKCNQPVATAPLKRKLYWHPVLIYLVIFINIILYAIVAAIVRKRAELHIYLCDYHLRRRKYFMIGGWSGSILGLVLAATGTVMQISWLIVGGFVLLVVALIAGVAGATIGRPARIKNDTVWLTGAGKDFVSSLPPYP